MSAPVILIAAVVGGATTWAPPPPPLFEYPPAVVGASSLTFECFDGSPSLVVKLERNAGTLTVTELSRGGVPKLPAAVDRLNRAVGSFKSITLIQAYCSRGSDQLTLIGQNASGTEAGIVGSFGIKHFYLMVNQHYEAPLALPN